MHSLQTRIAQLVRGRKFHLTQTLHTGNSFGECRFVAEQTCPHAASGSFCMSHVQEHSYTTGEHVILHGKAIEVTEGNRRCRDWKSSEREGGREGEGGRRVRE